MKLLGLFALLILLSLPLQAAKDCYRHRVRGKITITENGASILVNAGTKSERTFRFTEPQLARVAGHTHLNVVTDLILPSLHPVSGSEVLAIESIRDTVPHPLRGSGPEGIRKVSCPQMKK